MRPRTNLKLLLIAIGLSAYAYFFERTAAPWAKVGKAFPDLEPADILELDISRPLAPKDAALGIEIPPLRLRLEGTPASWWLVEPIHFEADHPRVMGILYELAGLVRVAEAKGSMTAGEPEIVVRFKTRSGSERLLEIGAEHPDPQLPYLYVRVGGESFLTHKELRKTLLVSLTDLRSRALVPIARPDAVELDIGGSPKFAKTIGRPRGSFSWRLRRPLEALADRELTESLLDDLNAWTISSFVKDDALRQADLEPFGLVKPWLTISVRRHDGYTRVVEVGKEHEDKSAGLVYARHAGEPFVFSASQKPFAAALESVEAMRSRYVLDLGLEEITELAFEAAGSQTILRRLAVTARKEEKGLTQSPALQVPTWQIIEPARSQALPGDRHQIDGLMAELRKCLILKFQGDEVGRESVGLSPPRGKLLARTSGGRGLTIEIGEPAGEAAGQGQHVYNVAVPGEPGSYLVRTPLPELFQEGPHAFREKSLSNLELGSIFEIEVRDGGEQWALWRTPSDPWTLHGEDAAAPPAGAAGAKKVEESRVNDLLELLQCNRFRVRRYLPAVKDFAGHGLELTRPRRALKLLHVEGERPAFTLLVLGDKAEPSSLGEVEARIDDGVTPPFTVAEEVAKAFEALASHLRAITAR